MNTIQGLSIPEAARALRVSTRTVRRFIKAGKLKAELVQGQFGEEYRIPELPAELQGSNHHNSGPVQATVNATVQAPVQPSANYADLLRDLQEKNLTLAAQLGAATERIRNLENQVKLLDAPKQSWWQRLFFWKKAKPG